jgi:hypothetical protein
MTAPHGSIAVPIFCEMVLGARPSGSSVEFYIERLGKVLLAANLTPDQADALADEIREAAAEARR